MEPTLVGPERAPDTSSGAALLRVGLLIDSPMLRRFQREIVKQIEAGAFARVVLVIYRRQAAEPDPPIVLGASALRTAIDLLIAHRSPRRLLFDLYRHLDASRTSGPKDPLATVDCRELLDEIPSLTVEPIVDSGAHRLPAASIEEIRRRDLDVILRFGFEGLRGDVLTAARHGVWSLRHGDPSSDHGEPAYFREMLERNPVSSVALEVLSEDPGSSAVLCRGHYRTIRASLTLNGQQPYWASATLVTQKLRELAHLGWEHVERAAEPKTGSADQRRSYAVPTNWEMARFLGPMILGNRTKRFRTETERHWRIALRVGKPLRLGGGGPLDLTGFRFHEPPRGHFYADPFLVRRDDKTWLFFEDYSYATRRGTLGAAEVLPDGSLGEAEPVLARPYHLSYPCVFQDGDEWYMIPETGDNGTIELYRATEFPRRWVLEKELMRCVALDSTIFRKDDRYWLFTSVLEPHARARQLCLYHAKDLFGDWAPHSANPISNDIRTNRGAGAIVSQDGTLYRLSQDCSRAYGHSFTFHEITRLDPAGYAERPVATVRPTWANGLVGTHTYARSGDVEAIDAAVRLPRSAVGADAPPT